MVIMSLFAALHYHSKEEAVGVGRRREGDSIVYSAALI